MQIGHHKEFPKLMFQALTLCPSKVTHHTRLRLHRQHTIDKKRQNISSYFKEVHCFGLRHCFLSPVTLTNMLRNDTYNRNGQTGYEDLLKLMEVQG